MRYVAMAPDLQTGRLVPYCDAAGHEIQFEAASQDEAHRKAKAIRLPLAVLVMPDQLRGGSH